MSLLREALPDFSWWRKVDVRHELISGLIGALLVIPQAITFAYVTGVAPEYGLYCAVFVGFFASLLGNSPMVGGPNTAVSILIGLTVIPFAGRGSPLYVELVLALSLMVGLIQLLIWLVRGGALFRYLSPSAIVAIKVGVGVWLISSALEGATGMAPMITKFLYEKYFIILGGWRELVNPYAAVVSAVTVVAGLLLRERWRRSYIVLGVLIGSAVGGAIYGWIGPVASDLELLGHVTITALPLQLPVLGPPHWLFLEHAIGAGIAIAVLGLAQSLVIARDLKATVSPNLDLHKEVFAQGMSNTLGPFFSSFAGSGSFNRTAVALEMGARTPLSGLVAAIAVVLLAWLLGPVLTYLPMAVVAGVMVLVGIGMIQLREIRPMLNRVDGPVFAITLFTVLFIGLETGILVAVVASVIFFVASASKVRLAISHAGETEHVKVTGNLFYASLDPLAKHLHAHPRAVTSLDLSRVSFKDATAMELIERVKRERADRGGKLEVVE